MKLVDPFKIDESNFTEFIDEFKFVSETLTPYSLNQKDMDFKTYLKSLRDESLGIDIPPNWVPASTFFMVDDNSKIHGATNIRHKLTPNLKVVGGHVGYGIRPTSRNQGHGTKILELSIDKLVTLGVNKILVTCDKVNIASARVIIKNGGTLDTEAEVNNNLVQRYWIKL